jgi:hypothetical protein
MYCSHVSPTVLSTAAVMPRLQVRLLRRRIDPRAAVRERGSVLVWLLDDLVSIKYATVQGMADGDGAVDCVMQCWAAGCCIEGRR